MECVGSTAWGRLCVRVVVVVVVFGQGRWAAPCAASSLTLVHLSHLSMTIIATTTTSMHSSRSSIEDGLKRTSTTTQRPGPRRAAGGAPPAAAAAIGRGLLAPHVAAADKPLVSAALLVAWESEGGG